MARCIAKDYLMWGASGPLLEEWQRLTQKLGYPLAREAEFGPKTLLVTELVQSRLGLKRDGIVSPMVMEKAKSLLGTLEKCGTMVQSGENGPPS